jgi:hypothetical protein
MCSTNLNVQNDSISHVCHLVSNGDISAKRFQDLTLRDLADFTLEKMFALNNRWYVQAKIGYGILKINADEFTQNLTVKENYNLSTLYGYGLGYKFLIKERISFDLFLGKHFQKFPGSSSSIEAIRQYQTNRWNSSIGEPIEFQWSVGFQFY